MPKKATRIGDLEVMVGSAPATPIPVVPGQRVKATVVVTNGGVLPIPSLTFRLVLIPPDRTPIEGPAEDYGLVENVAAGARVTVEVYRWIPSNWGAGLILARVDGRVDTGDFQIIEEDPNPCWQILPPSPTWLVDVVITYSAV